MRPTSAANSGRVGYATCNVVVRAHPETANRTQASINAQVRQEGPLSRTDALEAIGILQDGLLLESRITTVSGITSFFAVTRGRYDNINVTTTNTMAFMLIVQPGRIHALSCGAGVPDPRAVEESWATWRPTVIAIMGTMVIENY